VMIVSDLLGAVCFIVLAFIHSSPVEILAVGFIASVVAQPFGPASDAALPNLVDEEHLTWANGLLGAAGNAARLIGPALGGALYALGGPGWAFGVNAVSFVASAILIAAIRVSFRGATDEDDDRGALAGFAVIRRDPVLLAIVASWAIMYLAMDIAFVADPPLAKHFGVGSFGFGLIDTFFGAGALIGSLYARRITQRTEIRWIVAGMLGVAAGWAIIAVSPAFVPILVASFVAASFDAVGAVAGYSIIQRRTEDAVRGRVFAAAGMVWLIANAIGFILVGPLVQAFGPQPVYGVGGILSVGATVLFITLRHSTRIEPMPIDEGLGK